MSKEMLKRLIEERARIFEDAKKIVDAADAEKRDFTAAELEVWDKHNEGLDTLDKRIHTMTESQEREKRAEEAREKAERLIRPEQERQGRNDDQNGDESELERQVRAFLQGDVDQRAVDIHPEGRMTMQELRTLSKLTSNAGGNTVKTSFYNQLQAHLIEVSGILNAGPTVLNTDTGEALQIPKTASHSTAALTAEAAVIAASDPSFNQVTLNAYKYAVVVQVSNELANDTSIDLLGYLSMECGRAVGNAAGAGFITGTGSAQPSGVLTGATVGVTGGSGVGGVFTSDNIIDLYYSVIEPYRRSPSTGWLLRDATLAAVRKLKDTTGQYLWQPSLQIGAPDTILGKAVNTDPNMPAVGLGNKRVAFGDFSRYFLRQVNGMRFERSDDFAFTSDLVTFRCIWRADGVLVDQTGAVKTYVGNAA